MTSRPPMTVSQMNCTMKDRYASERIAERAAERVGTKRGVRLSTYRCKHCKDWHLTKQGQPRKVKPPTPRMVKPPRMVSRPSLDDFEVVDA